MAYLYSVYSGFAFEEEGETNFDTLDSNDLLVINNIGRRPGKHNFARDFATFQQQIRDTYCQSLATTFNMTTFTTWLWFNSDTPLNDNVLLSRGQWGSPSWSIRTSSGCIAFEIGDGISYSHSILGPQVLQGDHFVAISYNETTGEMVLYYDGAVVNRGQSPVFMPADPIGIAVGSYVDGGVPFNGWIDSILFTNLVLTTTDLDWIYNGTLGRDIWEFVEIDFPGSICIFKKDKILLLEKQQISILEKDKMPIIEILSGRR